MDYKLVDTGKGYKLSNSKTGETRFFGYKELEILVKLFSLMEIENG